MSVTRVDFRISMEEYQHLILLANQRFDGNLSAMIRHYLPKKDTIESWLKESENEKEKTRT